MFTFFLIWHRQPLDQGKEQEDHQAGHADSSEGGSSPCENKQHSSSNSKKFRHFSSKLSVLKFRAKAGELGIDQIMANGCWLHIVGKPQVLVLVLSLIKF